MDGQLSFLTELASPPKAAPVIAKPKAYRIMDIPLIQPTKKKPDPWAKVGKAFQDVDWDEERERLNQRKK